MLIHVLLRPEALKLNDVIRMEEETEEGKGKEGGRKEGNKNEDMMNNKKNEKYAKITQSNKKQVNKGNKERQLTNGGKEINTLKRRGGKKTTSKKQQLTFATLHTRVEMEVRVWK